MIYHPGHLTGFAVGLLLMWATDGFAQIGAPGPLKVHEEILVRESGGNSASGRSTAVSEVSITLDTPDGLLNGTLIGIGAGVVGEVIGIATSNYGVSGSEVAGRVVVGIGVGAAAGALIDRAITRTRQRTFVMDNVVEIRRHDTVLNGLFIGLGIGSAVGFASLAASVDSKCDQACDFLFYGAPWMAPLVGGVAGALFDHLHGNDLIYRKSGAAPVTRTIDALIHRRPPPAGAARKISLSVAPVFAKRATGFGGTLRF